MRRFITISLILALALAGVTAAFAAWLLYTPGGFAWLASRATRMTDGALTLDQPAGTLAHGVTIARLQYQTPTLNARVEDMALSVRPISLLWLTPHIEHLNASKLVLHTIPTTDAPNEPLQVPALPVAIRADAIRAGTVEIHGGAEPIELEEVSLRYAADATQHELRDVALRARGFAISLGGRIATVTPYPLTGTMTVKREQGTPEITASLELSGNLEKLSVALAGSLAGAQVKASGDIEPGSRLPLARVEAQVAAFDARVLDATLPQTAITADIKLARADERLTGDIAVRNALDGPYSDQRLPLGALRSSVLTDLTTVELKALVATLHGGGTLSGSASLGTGRAALALTARNIDLRALHERLHTTHLSGKLDAALTPDRQSITANLTQDELRLRLVANLAGDTVTLHDATFYARGGEAKARGSLSLSDTQPFSTRVELRNFDPAAWGDFPAGSINGALTGQGTVAGRSIKAQFDIAKSRLRNAPFAGGGKIALQGSQLSTADFNVRLGNNRADVKGAFGAPKDTLQIRFDAPQLALIHDAVQGQVKGEAHIAGGLDHPQVRFEAQASALRAAGASIQRAKASGTLARAANVPLRFNARLQDVSYEGRQVSTVIAELTGPQSDHVFALKAQGKDYDAEVRARGAWSMEQRTWSGTLLQLSNRGTLDAALEGPLKLIAAPDRVTLGRSAIRVLDGRLELEELTYRPGHLSTSGRFTKVPAIRLANLVQPDARVAGDLRLSGAWSLVQDGALTGSLAVKRDAGDIVLGVNGGLPMQLQALSVEARLDRTRLEVQAALKSATANAEGSGTIGVVPSSGVFPLHGDSPLRASVRVAVAELAAVARLLDANALVNGALQGTLSMTGTLSRPIVNGEVRGERLAYALPPQGVDLRDGTLRAAVNDRTVRVEAFSIRSGAGLFTARGDLGFNGAGAKLDWQAERLLLLARPDRRLVVSGKGRAGLVDGALSLSGGVQVNDGYFEIGPDALPEPGPDVIIAGEKPRTKEQSPLARMFLELVVNLGENLRVRGHGIDTRLAGEIVVATKPGQPLQTKGTLRTVRGVYTVLGQRLEIDRGELLFSGPINNPGLNIRAMRKRQAVEAGVEVTGTMNAPLARIVSDPPVAESEAISWLVLGHGTGDASRGDLAMLPLAASSLLGKGDSRTLAQRLGVDTLGLRGAGGENQFVTVGKRIADRLYVAFEQSLGAAQSILKLEFDLTDRILLRAQTGEANAVGVFYRYTFD